MRLHHRFLLAFPCVTLLLVACGGDDQTASTGGSGAGAAGGASSATVCGALLTCCESLKLNAMGISECTQIADGGNETTCGGALSGFQHGGQCRTVAGAGGTTSVGAGGHNGGATTVGPVGLGPVGMGQMGTGGNSDMGPVGMGPVGMGAGGSQGMGPGGGTIYCGATDGTECSCGTAPASGWSTTESCSPASVPGPSLCCALSTYPNNDPSAFSGLGCVCSKVTCIEAGTADYCSCGFSASPTAGDHVVPSCSGSVCCRSKSFLAPICYCFTSTSVKCSDINADDEDVGSCGTGDVECGSDGVVTVPACR